MLAFSLSNGYLSTLIMLASVVEPSLEQDEVEVRPLPPSRLSLSTRLLTSSSARRSPPPASPSTSPRASPSARSSRSACAAPSVTVTLSSRLASRTVCIASSHGPPARLLLSLAAASCDCGPPRRRPSTASPRARPSRSSARADADRGSPDSPRTVRLGRRSVRRLLSSLSLARSTSPMRSLAICFMETRRPRAAAAPARAAPAARAAGGGACAGGLGRAQPRRPPRAQAAGRAAAIRPRTTQNTMTRCVSVFFLCPSAKSSLTSSYERAASPRPHLALVVPAPLHHRHGRR